MRSFILLFITLLTQVTCSPHNKHRTNSTEIRHNETETELHLNKRYYGKNQNRNGSNDKSVLVKRKVERVEKVDGGVHQNRNRGGR
jgi:hypothetical protein